MPAGARQRRSGRRLVSKIHHLVTFPILHFTAGWEPAIARHAGGGSAEVKRRALAALYLFQRDKQYLVRGGKLDMNKPDDANLIAWMTRVMRNRFVDRLDPRGDVAVAHATLPCDAPRGELLAVSQEGILTARRRRTDAPRYRRSAR